MRTGCPSGRHGLKRADETFVSASALANTNIELFSLVVLLTSISTHTNEKREGERKRAREKGRERERKREAGRNG